MASTTCGKNNSPYWVLESPYSAALVKIVLKAGNVTSTMPCTRPAALTVARSALEAIGHPKDPRHCSQVKHLGTGRGVPRLFWVIQAPVTNVRVAG